MNKEITIKEFCDELINRIDSEKGVDCCKKEIKNLAEIAGKEIGDKIIVVDWKEA